MYQQVYIEDIVILKYSNFPHYRFGEIMQCSVTLVVMELIWVRDTASASSKIIFFPKGNYLRKKEYL